MKGDSVKIKGRFAPSPTGRMHLGNVWAALLSWVSAKSKGGSWILRHEDLDPQRSRRDYARMIEDDLHWLGLEWDEGGLDGYGGSGPYEQSRRGAFYDRMLEHLRLTGLLFGCSCRRADLLAPSAPHASDGRPVYAGTCRPTVIPQLPPLRLPRTQAVRIAVADGEIVVDDMFMGRHTYALVSECGDFVVRRADGAFAYQLAVVADDAAMGVSEVVRGCDLLPSAAQQIYLYRLMGWREPRFGHVPLLCNDAGQRLSKRDGALSMEALRQRFKPREIIGWLGFLAGMLEEPEECSPEQLVPLFHKARLRESAITVRCPS